MIDVLESLAAEENLKSAPLGAHVRGRIIYGVQGTEGQIFFESG